MSIGLKDDSGKPRYSLVPWDSMADVVDVLEYGAEYYPTPDNWKNVSEGLRRYSDAAMRHLVSHMSGEYLDKKSGKPHLAHLAVNSLFALHFYRAQQVQTATVKHLCIVSGCDEEGTEIGKSGERICLGHHQ